ncbi:ribonuclease HI family protein [Salicibibacter cibi]|uniref:Ribonuclease HI family protein n=1 Tax=Salicibibacter cibi TaxID=2743001 RepID=A0A7T6ZAQ0_9BACI|nr:ribonuclease HI family protein [Salicibibacter cibi]QQK79995.1 ribonuclease HI family protein [Salicibibacter cibi]
MTTAQVVHVYVDAACNGDPGTCGYGLFMKHPSGQVEREMEVSQLTHIHEAEFAALYEGLKWARRFGYHQGRFFTDSQLVFDAVNQGAVKRSRYKHFLDEILLLSADFSLFIVDWLPTRANKEADRLAKKACFYS